MDSSQTTPGQGAADIAKAIQQMLAGVQKPASEAGMVLPPSTVPPPSTNIQFNPSGSGTSLPVSPSRPQATQIPPTGSQGIGEFATKRGSLNAGLTSLGNSLSGMFGAIEQKEQAKKSALAENYMLQINSLLASGDPQDKQKAMAILEDPKIRKTLKTGLEYVPLEEEVPPEAHGVASAQQKIASGKAPQIGGQQPQKRPIIPQASQEQQLKAAMTNALLQKIKQDPASAISMMGGSQLSSAEQRAGEFYEKGLGLTPAQVAMMSSTEKLQGLKMLEASTVAAFRAEADLYKTQVGYKGKVDAATIMAKSREFVADRMKEAWQGRDKAHAAGANVSAGAKIYEDLSKKYLDIIKSGKGPDGIKPLTDDQKKMYQQKADALQKQADDYLNQSQDQDLMQMFMKSMEEEPDQNDDNPDNK